MKAATANGPPQRQLQTSGVSLTLMLDGGHLAPVHCRLSGGTVSLYALPTCRLVVPLPEHCGTVSDIAADPAENLLHIRGGGETMVTAALDGRLLEPPE